MVSFFDTPDLTLNKAGVVVRARRVAGREDDFVVKLRPVEPDDLPEHLRKSPNLGRRSRRDARWLRLLGVDEGAARHDDVRRSNLGERSRRKLFTKEQRAFYDRHAPEGIAIEDLELLGPIFVLKLKFNPEELRKRKMVAEMWLYPDGARILELSTKCAPADMFQVANEARGYDGEGRRRRGGANDEDRNRAGLLRRASERHDRRRRDRARRRQRTHAGPAGRLVGRAPVVGSVVRQIGAGSPPTGARRTVVIAPELQRVLDNVLAGPVTDAVARSLGQNRVAERVASQVLADLDVDSIVDAVLADERTERTLARMLESREMQLIIGHIAASPELLAAVTLPHRDARRRDGHRRPHARAARRRRRRADRARLASAPASTPDMTVTAVRVPYAGIATRAVALAIDAALAQAIVFVAGAVFALIASLVGDNIKFTTLQAVLAAVAWVVIVGFYFVLFWSTTGQTPGMRTMGSAGDRRSRRAPGLRALVRAGRRPRAGDHPARGRLRARAHRRPPPCSPGLPGEHGGDLQHVADQLSTTPGRVSAQITHTSRAITTIAQSG